LLFLTSSFACASAPEPSVDDDPGRVAQAVDAGAPDAGDDVGDVDAGEVDACPAVRACILARLGDDVARVTVNDMVTHYQGCVATEQLEDDVLFERVVESLVGDGAPDQTTGWALLRDGTCR
jgi:hypothetical protein